MSNQKKSNEKNFTLNMAKSRLSVGYTKNNKNFVSFWENQNTFKKVNEKFKNNNVEKYVLLDGPPYANGPLHLGHALNKNFKDLVVKSRWYNGQPVSFRPGWDCHGLPLELAVEKKHGRQKSLKMKELCKELALNSVENHKVGFKSLGVLADWENPYLTLSDENLKGNWDTLADLVDKDLLVYKQYPVHYCADCGSSLASAELETKLLPKHSLYFKMKLDSLSQENVYAVVWTTTPWTLPMNQGLAFRNKLDFQGFYSHKLNEHLVLEKTAVNELEDYLKHNEFELLYEETDLSHYEVYAAFQPVTGEKVLLKPAEFVEEGKTGFVHTAFAHGAEDFEFGMKYGVLPKTYLNKFGKFDTSNNENLDFLNGMNREQASKAMVEFLKEKNTLLKHSVAEQEQNVCWRHKSGVFYNATWQVFLDLQNPKFNLKERVKELMEVSELTSHDKEQLSLMLLNRAHWCLSRQRTWGCEMNLLVDKTTNELSPLSASYLRYLSQGDNTKAKELLEQNSNLEVFKDVLDVWFDSGNVVNTYKSNYGVQTDKYVVDMALEGKDQYRGWFQAMMWLSVAKNNMLPYKHLFCHGFVLNTDKEKFSKSAGNAKGLDYYLDLYGADVLRLWVASQENSKDAVFSETKLKEMQTVYSRLRLTLRFLTSNLYDYNVEKHQSLWNEFKNKENFDLERFVLKQTLSLHNEFKKNFETYNFKNPLDSLYEFTNKTLSNFFFDFAKNPLYLRKLVSEDRLKLQVVMFELLLAMFDMVKVYAPFVAEEFYLDFFGDKNSVFEQNYFTLAKEKELEDLVVNLDWEKVMELRKTVFANLDKLQKEKVVKARTEVFTFLNVSENKQNLLKNVKHSYRLREVFGVSNVEVQSKDNNKEDVVVTFKVLNNLSEFKKCPKCWNYEYSNSFKGELCYVCDEDEKE